MFVKHSGGSSFSVHLPSFSLPLQSLNVLSHKNRKRHTKAKGLMSFDDGGIRPQMEGTLVRGNNVGNKHETRARILASP